ncbi:hypothetical protein ABFS82_10G049400 [Erythranthe guttata]
MAQKKQLLHELLQEDQEPFHLNTYISDLRSRFIPPPSATTTTTLQVINKRRQPPAAGVAVASTSRSNLCSHACFLSFHQNSPDVLKSPFFDFPSPAKSPCKSSPGGGGVFLHIPSRTAAVLVEAAMRIQKQQQSKAAAKAAAARTAKTAGLGLFGSFLKRLKDRSKSKKRALQNIELNFPAENKVDENVRMSCSCSNRRPSSADWTENNEEADFEASTNSSCGSDYCSEEIIINSDFDLVETRFCLSPFRFSLLQTPSSSGRRTPDFCSPAASPSRRVNQENENYEARNVDKEEEEEEKKQCSPVSILEPPFEDDLRETEDAEELEEDDYDLDCGYENVERAKQQLLHRLRRFEKLAELDPIELERKLLVASDEESEGYYSEDDVAALYKKQSVETFVGSKNMSTDMKRLVSDLIVEEKSEVIWSVNSNEVVMGRISNKLDSWKEVEFDTIDMMIGLDFKKEFDLWTNFREQVEETSAEIEVAVFRVLIEELSDEIFDLRTQFN